MIKCHWIIHKVSFKSICKTGEIHVRPVDSSLQFPGFGSTPQLVHHSYVKCRHWGQLGDGFVGLPCTVFATSCECIIYSNKRFHFKIYVYYISWSSTNFQAMVEALVTEQKQNIKVPHEKISAKIAWQTHARMTPKDSHPCMISTPWVWKRPGTCS